MARLDEVCPTPEEAIKRKIFLAANRIEELTHEIDISRERDLIRRQVKIILKLTK